MLPFIDILTSNKAIKVETTSQLEFVISMFLTYSENKGSLAILPKLSRVGKIALASSPIYVRLNKKPCDGLSNIGFTKDIRWYCSHTVIVKFSDIQFHRPVTTINLI